MLLPGTVHFPPGNEHRGLSIEARDLDDPDGSLVYNNTVRFVRVNGSAFAFSVSKMGRVLLRTSPSGESRRDRSASTQLPASASRLCCIFLVAEQGGGPPVAAEIQGPETKPAPRSKVRLGAGDQPAYPGPENAGEHASQTEAWCVLCVEISQGTAQTQTAACWSAYVRANRVRWWCCSIDMPRWCTPLHCAS